MSENTDSFEQLVDNFDFSGPKKEQPIVRRAVTIWLSPAYHNKYETLQTRHKKKFCRLIKELTEMAIDKKFKAG